MPFTCSRIFNNRLHESAFIFWDLWKLVSDLRSTFLKYVLNKLLVLWMMPKISCFFDFYCILFTFFNSVHYLPSSLLLLSFSLAFAFTFAFQSFWLQRTLVILGRWYSIIINIGCKTNSLGLWRLLFVRCCTTDLRIAASHNLLLLLLYYSSNKLANKSRVMHARSITKSDRFILYPYSWNLFQSFELFKIKSNWHEINWLSI